MTKLSVIIPTYNYGAMLPRAVNSVLDQPGDQYEVIIVDDGSTDDTQEVGEAMAREFSNVHYLRKSNGGPAAARNLGLASAKGEYLMFLDADDELVANLFDQLMPFIQAQPINSFILGAHITVSPSGKEKTHSLAHLDDDAGKRLSAYLFGNLSVCPGACVSHRKLFEQIRYPEHLRASEDISVFAQCLVLANCIKLEIPFVKMHKHDDSLRHQSHLVKAAGLKVVDAVFDEAVMPSQYQYLKPDFLGRRALSLFRSCYLAGDYKEAETYYRLAIRQKPKLIFSWNYLSKFIRIKLFK